MDQVRHVHEPMAWQMHGDLLWRRSAMCRS